MKSIEIVEMSARDGLQNEKALVTVADKVRLIDLLSLCGFARIEAASFVSPRWVPQMADGSQVMAAIARRTGTRYTVLTPNLKGYEAAREAGVDEVAVFGSASEAFSKANINCTVSESLERFRPVVEAAKAQGVPVRGYVSCVIACPYSGPVEPDAPARVTEQLLRMGCHEISLGDTIGAGTPETVDAMLRAVLDAAPAERLAGHYHDTNGRALDNIEVSLSHGLRVFDAAVGGLGGCPYAPGAKGNVDTLAVADRVRALGFETGLDRAMLEDAAAFARSLRTQG